MPADDARRTDDHAGHSEHKPAMEVSISRPATGPAAIDEHETGAYRSAGSREAAGEPAGPEGDEHDADDAEARAEARHAHEHDEDDVTTLTEMAAQADPRTREELYAALVMAEAQRDEYLDDLRRSRAEFDNFRRRTSKDLATQRDAGKSDLALALLETLDDLDRTLQAAEASRDEQLAHGVQMVAAKLRTSLEQAGLERVDATGVPFDPERHEAVGQRPAADVERVAEAADGPVVAEVLRPGYRWGERVLRAAMVLVEE